jgi:hypothetical protein
VSPADLIALVNHDLQHWPRSRREHPRPSSPHSAASSPLSNHTQRTSSAAVGHERMCCTRPPSAGPQAP